MQKNFRTTKGYVALIKALAESEGSTETKTIEMAIMSYAIRKFGVEKTDEIMDNAYKSSTK